MTPVALRRAPTFDVQLLDTDGNFVTYKIAFDFKAICEAKAALGISLFNPELWDKIETEPETLITVMWTALLSHHPHVTLDELPYMMVPSKFGEYLSAILLAWTAVKPKVEETANPKREPMTEPVSVQK
jgi:hypothetical protein